MGRFDDALEDVRRFAKGDYRGFFVDTFMLRPVSDFTPAEIKAIRHAAKMPQCTFASCLGVSEKSIEAWEGGRSHPVGAARRLLELVKDDPEFFTKTGIYRRTHTDYATHLAQRKTASARTQETKEPPGK